MRVLYRACTATTAGRSSVEELIRVGPTGRVVRLCPEPVPFPRALHASEHPLLPLVVRLQVPELRDELVQVPRLLGGTVGHLDGRLGTPMSPLPGRASGCRGCFCAVPSAEPLPGRAAGRRGPVGAVATGHRVVNPRVVV